MKAELKLFIIHSSSGTCWGQVHDRSNWQCVSLCACVGFIGGLAEQPQHKGQILKNDGRVQATVEVGICVYILFFPLFFWVQQMFFTIIFLNIGNIKIIFSLFHCENIQHINFSQNITSCILQYIQQKLYIAGQHQIKFSTCWTPALVPEEDSQYWNEVL